MTPLPSWNETNTKQNILNFVTTVTDENGPGYVPPSERIAVFDNDGTLWCEKPMYIQLDYILRKLAKEAGRNTELQSKQPWKAAWEKNYEWLGGAISNHYQGNDDDLKILLAGILSVSEGQVVEKVEAASRKFIENERHPTLGLPYKDCIYQPMLELLQYLETKGFLNYIVSGGGRDFMRGFAMDLYGVPRERVIGSTVAYQYRESAQGCEIVQKADMDVIDDGPGKPIQIWNLVGRRPILAVGNSNGDLPMLMYSSGSSFPTLCMVVLHDDSQREFDYSAGAEKILQTAAKQGWTAVSMRNDFRRVFPR